MNDRGFTFVEMCIAMAITAMTGLAIFAFASVTTKTWQATEHAHQLEVSSLQAQSIMTDLIERSRALAVVSDSQKLVMVWLTDSFDGTADGQAQFAELAVIEYDQALRSLILYRADMSAAEAARQEAAEIITTAGLSNVEYAFLLKRMQWLDTPRTLLGPGRRVDAGRQIARVDAVTLTPVTTAGLPAFEMNVTLSRGRDTKQQSSVFVVRAPTSRPNYANTNE